MMDATEAPEIEGVRCGGCGARTPILDSRTPRCAYCGSSVAVPQALLERASRIEGAVDDARRSLNYMAWELEPKRPAFTTIMMLLQTAYVATTVVWWFRFVQPESLSSPQVWLLLCIASGPLLFLVIAREYNVGRQLGELAKLAFARVVVQTSETGVTLEVRCPGCGARIEQATLRGLTIACGHCHCHLLAPCELVDERQRGFHKRVVALRTKLQRRFDLRANFMWIVGPIYIAVTLRAMGPGQSSADLALSMACFGSCGAWVYWAAGMYSDENFWLTLWMGCWLWLAPMAMTAFYFIDMTYGH